MKLSIIVQDADLEYDPSEIPKLLAFAESALPRKVAVYGRRPSCWGMPSRWLFATGVLGIDCLLLMVTQLLRCKPDVFISPVMAGYYFDVP